MKPFQNHLISNLNSISNLYPPLLITSFIHMSQGFECGYLHRHHYSAYLRDTHHDLNMGTATQALKPLYYTANHRMHPIGYAKVSLMGGSRCQPYYGISPFTSWMLRFSNPRQSRKWELMAELSSLPPTSEMLEEYWLIVAFLLNTKWGNVFIRDQQGSR